MSIFNQIKEVKIMSANVESMFYVREKPWHGLGVRVEEAPTSIDALVLAGLDRVRQVQGGPERGRFPVHR